MKYKRTLSTAFVIAIGLAFALFSKDALFFGKERVPRTHITYELPITKIWVDGPHGKKVDIGPTLLRIKKGKIFPHRNDGSVFGNREKKLPLKKRGYYLEYVHPTLGKKGPGAQRVIIGTKKETYYTPDHYKTFQEIKENE